LPNVDLPSRVTCVPRLCGLSFPPSGLWPVRQPWFEPFFPWLVFDSSFRYFSVIFVFDSPRFFFLFIRPPRCPSLVVSSCRGSNLRPFFRQAAHRHGLDSLKWLFPLPPPIGLCVPPSLKTFAPFFFPLVFARLATLFLGSWALSCFLRQFRSLTLLFFVERNPEGRVAASPPASSLTFSSIQGFFLDHPATVPTYSRRIRCRGT